MPSPKRAGRTVKSSGRRPTALDARIGQLIRQRRLHLSLRIEDLAGRLLVTPHQLQKYEVGENRIAASRLIDCARALDVPVAWFYQSATGNLPQTTEHNALAADEIELLNHYRSLAPEARQKLLGIADLLAGDTVTSRVRAKRS